MITYDVHVLMGSSAPYQGPEIKCNDTGVNLRIFPEISIKLSRLRETREIYRIPPYCTAVLKVAKKDKTFAVCDGEIKGNSIFFRLPPQACTVIGEAEAEVNIFDAMGDRVTTATFPITITKEAVSEHSQDSKMYVDILSNYIKDTTKAKEEAEAAAEEATEAADKAEAAQVNVPIIGENGNWYVWDAETGSYKDTGVKAQGPQGDTGAQGPAGEKGEPGENGISVTHRWYGTMLAISSASGTSGMNLIGPKGDTGERGPAGEKGEPGDPYVLTDGDKAEIVNSVLDALPNLEEVSF